MGNQYGLFKIKLLPLVQLESRSRLAADEYSL